MAERDVRFIQLYMRGWDAHNNLPKEIRDQSAAVDMMLRGDNGFSPTATVQDFQMVIDGRVSPYLLFDKHPIALGAVAFALLMLFLILLRLFSAPRPRETEEAGTKA